MERLRRHEVNPWDDVVRFVVGETTLQQLQVYLQEHHPELKLSDDKSVWQGHVVQRAACAQNPQLIKDIVNIAGRHLLEPIDGRNLINWCILCNRGEKLLKTVQALIELGVDVNHVTTYEGSPLHYVTQKEDEDEGRDLILESLLLDHGAVLIPPKKIRSSLE